MSRVPRFDLKVLGDELDTPILGANEGWKSAKLNRTMLDPIYSFLPLTRRTYPRQTHLPLPCSYTPLIIQNIPMTHVIVHAKLYESSHHYAEANPTTIAKDVAVKCPE